MFEIKTFPDFSWSLSRHKSIMDCQRKYAYEYYLSHNGWLKYNVNPDSQHAYRLKKLLDLPILVGQITHEIIEEAIKSIMFTFTIPNAEQLERQARNKLNQAYLESINQKSSWHLKPNHYHMIFDIYYNGVLNKEEVQEYQERLGYIFKNFLHSKTVQEMITRKKEVGLNQTEEFRFILIDGIKVFIVMDMLYQDLATKKWVIVDWKTGKESQDDRNQLALYAYYLMKKLNIPLEDIVVRNEYLLSGTQKESQLNEIDIESLLYTFNQSILYMKQFQADILTNEPVDIVDFACTDYTDKCIKCKFKEICR